MRVVTLALCVFVAGCSSATPARLIGKCDGQILAAMEEDDFPDGCEWIEPIHAD